MNKKEITDVLLHLSKDSRLRSFKVSDIVKALTSTKNTVLCGNEVLPKSIAPTPAYVSKVNGHMIVVNYGSFEGYPVATINIWIAGVVVHCPAPFDNE